MPNKRRSQRYDEVTSGGGGAEAARSERRPAGRARAAAETTYEPAHATAAAARQVAADVQPEVAVPPPPLPEAQSTGGTVRAARRAGGILGRAVRYARNLQTEDVVTGVKQFVRRHPSALAGAAVMGFLTGRKLQGR